jgi:hypothetical protein
LVSFEFGFLSAYPCVPDWEECMRKISSATVLLIVGVALYFSAFWGFDALRALTSPTYGLEDVWHSQYVFGVGSLLGLGPTGLMQLAAFFAVMKLAVAAICALHVLDRLRSLAGGKVNLEIFEGGLILAALIAVASAIPAMLSHNSDLLREQAIQLAFAALAIALCMVERSHAAKAVDAAAASQDARWFAPWR